MASDQLPSDFLWGFATASYQIEGASNEDGRADSIWDTFCRIPGKVADGTNGEIACDSYHRYHEDIALLKSLGAKAYRFSVSWSRVIPLGGRDDPINAKGLEYYKNVVDELVRNGIIPVVTLFHWDLPQTLYDRYGGFLNQTEFVKDYVRFAELMFRTIGFAVKHWITFNEPWCSSILGYNTGAFAPGHTSDRSKNQKGDSATEAWLVGHSLLVAHGSAVRLYRHQFKQVQGGQIGITLNGDATEPWDAEDPADIEAAQRKLKFSIAWFADPIYKGEYPASMREQLGDRLPKFTTEERALVLGSNDFYGMNCYTADYIKHIPEPASLEDFNGNVVMLKENKQGVAIGPESECISARYGRPPIFVTENGTSVKGESHLSLEQAHDDEFRAQYFREYITALVAARTEDGVDIRGYMAWSLLGNFEWAEGYLTRFGVTYVDYSDGQKRYLKKSARIIADMFVALCSSSA